VSPGFRKLLLTSHIAVSVAWLGAVLAFLALAIAGLVSPSAAMVRAAYLSMDLVGWFVIVPLGLASVVTGLIEALSTPWGLFRHYWVVMKLSVTTALTLLLIVHMRPTRRLAAVAVETTVSGSDLHPIQMQLAVDAASAIVALIVVIALGIYKPRGLTRYGARRLGDSAEDAAAPSGPTPRWVIVFALAAVVSLVAVRILSGAGHHNP
jgi:hypothetical protein